MKRERGKGPIGQLLLCRFMGECEMPNSMEVGPFPGKEASLAGSWPRMLNLKQRPGFGHTGGGAAEFAGGDACQRDDMAPAEFRTR